MKLQAPTSAAPSPEVCAAIALALHLHRSGAPVHDQESNVLTLQVKDSPWNAKIRSFRRTPLVK